jgi:hypothetical protein
MTMTIEMIDCDGDSCGCFRPVRFDDDTVGWESTDGNGTLLGLIDAAGVGSNHPADRGNCSWELCEETPNHRRALALHAEAHGCRIVR